MQGYADFPSQPCCFFVSFDRSWIPVAFPFPPISDPTFPVNRAFIPLLLLGVGSNPSLSLPGFGTHPRGGEKGGLNRHESRGHARELRRTSRSAGAPFVRVVGKKEVVPEGSRGGGAKEGKGSCRAIRKVGTMVEPGMHRR